MRYVTEDDKKIINKAKQLMDDYRVADQRWLDAVEKSRCGEISYLDTKPLNDIALDLHKKWQTFQNEHADKLFASRNNNYPVRENKCIKDESENTHLWGPNKDKDEK